MGTFAGFLHFASCNLNLKRTTILIFLIFSISILAQVQPEWKVFKTTNSPLPSNKIYNISTDTFNNKWIATDSGLVKITGDDFTNFSNWTIIPNMPVNVNILQVDKTGNIWMARGLAAFGLIKYNGQTFTIYNTQNSHIPDNYISGIAVDSLNNIWVMCGVPSDNPSEIYQKEKFKQEYLTDGPIYIAKFDGDSLWSQAPGNFGFQTWGDLAGIDSVGNIWTAREFKLTKTNTTTLAQTDYHPGLGLGLYITEVKPDFKGNIWIAGGTGGWGGLSIYDGQNFSYFNYKAYSLAVDNQRNVWVGTSEYVQDTTKLLKFNGTTWTKYTAYNSLLPKTTCIKNLEFDKRGNLWIATVDSGLAVYKQGGLILPVELISASYEITGNSVQLNWSTASEKNNKEFLIEKRTPSTHRLSDWKVVGYIEGNGTSTEIHNYLFIDKDVYNGKYTYRIIQVDYDGTRNIVKEIEIDINSLNEFSMEQNYPNPFNSTSFIKYFIPTHSKVLIKVFDILGNEIATLLNEDKPSGIYEVSFNADNLPSGIYFYRIQAGSFVDTKKMVLLR